jgi:hypothetical protein
MKQSPWTRIAPLTLALLAGCGGTKTQIPPRIDLHNHEVLGIIEFSSSSKGDLAPFATQRFIESVRRDQGLVRILELGTQEDVMRDLGIERLDAQAYRKLGERHGLTTIFTGELVVSDIRPSVRVGPSLSGMGVSADAEATLTVRMAECASGASIWSRSGSATRRVGEVSVFGSRDMVFDAEDPDKAYGELVDALIGQVTTDFRVSWARR